MFEWIAFYEELADVILAYRDRQDELIRLLGDIHAQGVPVVRLEDKDHSGEIPLAEIDPFTFYASFNRQVTDSNRIRIIETDPLPVN
jgi:5-methylcytosine-specific restriction protein B